MTLADRARILSRYRQFDTSSRDEIRDVLVSRYGAGEFDVAGRNKIRGVGSLIRLKDIDLGYLYFSQQIKASFPSMGYHRQLFSIAGRSTARFHGSQFVSDLSSTGVVPSNADADYEHGEEQAQLVFRVTDAAMQRKFTALTGHPISRKFDFAVSDSFENPRQRRLRRLIHAFVHEIEEGDLSTFASGEFSQLLIVKFLTANRHNWSHALDGRVLSTSPHHVTVVEEYIRANWDKPITIEELVEQTGIGTRSLFATFKKKRGYMPMSFQRLLRLQHGRQMLQSPTDETSVLAVSLRCGFHNAGHFAKYYKDAFGELPSTTLALARSSR